MAFFLEGVSRIGLPERIRTDHGGENIDIWRHMLDTHNNDPKCVVTGSSTHNERIERLWRDVHRCVAHFADTFRELESDGDLDPLNEVDMFCLHYVFLPRINKCIDDFRESWNNHPISTEGNMTPYQLFAEGIHCAAELNLPTTNTLLSITQNAQVTNNLPDVSQLVEVPEMLFAPCQRLCNQIQLSVNPLKSCNDNGKHLYILTIRTAGQHMQTGCDECSA